MLNVISPIKCVFQETDGITAALAEELFYKGLSLFCLPFIP